jgi:hypothetical protein
MLKVYERTAYGLKKDIYGRDMSSTIEQVTVVELGGKIEAIIFQAAFDDDQPSTKHETEEEFMKVHTWENIPWQGVPGTGPGRR